MSEMEQSASNRRSKNEVQEKSDTKKRYRDLVNSILPDSLMIALAVVMAPLVLIPVFVDLSDTISTFFNLLDYTILGIFIVEYLAKTILAPNIWKHIINPWHLLDLVVVVLPLVMMIPVITTDFGVSSPLIRLVRIFRLVVVGGRAVDRQRQLSAASKTEVKACDPIKIKLMYETPKNTLLDIPLNKIGEYLSSKSHTWVDISCVSDDDLDEISRILGIPRIILESEMVDESYPRVDNFEKYSMIFARVADYKINRKATANLSVSRAGLLVICQGQNIITLSKGHTEIFQQILEKAQRNYTPQDSLVVSILYTLLKYILEKDKQIIAALEQVLMNMESIPPKDRPSDFLESTFHLRKEVNQLVPSLLHLKEVIDVITSKRAPLDGFNENHAKIFDILLDEATYLHETASNARDNLLSLIDLYINTNSYEMNKVMRVIAVITSFSIIPAILGLLGSNISGNPWDIQLWQVFAGLGITVLIIAWVFSRLGWLKW